MKKHLQSFTVLRLNDELRVEAEDFHDLEEFILESDEKQLLEGLVECASTGKKPINLMKNLKPIVELVEDHVQDATIPNHNGYYHW